MTDGPPDDGYIWIGSCNSCPKLALEDTEDELDDEFERHAEETGHASYMRYRGEQRNLLQEAP